MTDMEELISVIVPVYNIEKYLPRCLQAISEQTYRNLEIILVDDGSTDRSGILCDEFAAKDSRARVIHQPNTGIWAARNAGHDAAHGDYLYFPDGDDYFHQDLIRILYEAVNYGNGYDLAICNRIKTKKQDEDTSSPIPISLIEITQEDLFLGLFNKGNKGNYFSHNLWNKLFRRCLIDRLRNRPYPAGQDRDFLMRLYVFIEDAIVVDNVLYYWVQHNDSVMHSSSYPFLRSMSHVKMEYSNYQSLPENKKKYGHVILEDLYDHLLLWLDMAWNTTDRKQVFSECKTILNHTWDSFLCCQDIPFRKRVSHLLFARFPKLTHYSIRLIRRLGSTLVYPSIRQKGNC